MLGDFMNLVVGTVGRTQATTPITAQNNESADKKVTPSIQEQPNTRNTSSRTSSSRSSSRGGVTVEPGDRNTGSRVLRQYTLRTEL